MAAIALEEAGCATPALSEPDHIEFALEPKPTRREYAQLIEVLVGEGRSISEIALQIGLPRHRVRKIMVQFRIRSPRPGPGRRISVHLPRYVRDTIEAEAKAAGLSVSAYKRRVDIAFYGDPSKLGLIRKVVGKQGMKTRRYQRGGRS